MVLALGRLALGAAIEAAFCESDARDAPATHAARTYNDAYLVAVWTSAHAQYISYIQSGVEDPPPPSINSVPNAASELDFSDVFARRTCLRSCHKPAQPLLRVFMRCTNPGARGWDSLLDSALSNSMAARLIIGNATTIALAAMHPYISPARRPNWFCRMQIMRLAQHRLTDADVRAAVVETAVATKECVRRLLATNMVASLATQNALRDLKHPLGLLSSPPMALPPRGLETSMEMFAVAGSWMVESGDYAASVNRAFSTDGKFDPSWLGAPAAARRLARRPSRVDWSQARGRPLSTRRCPSSTWPAPSGALALGPTSSPSGRIA